MLSNQSNKPNVNRNFADYQKYLNQHNSSTSQLLENINFEQIADCLNVLFLARYNRPLSTVENLILQGVWQGKTYSEIASESNYSPDYFSNVAAPKLLKQLSKIIGNRITKKSCRSLVTKYIMKSISNQLQNYAVRREQNTDVQNELHGRKYDYSSQINFFDSTFLQDAMCLAQVI